MVSVKPYKCIASAHLKTETPFFPSHSFVCPLSYSIGNFFWRLKRLRFADKNSDNGMKTQKMCLLFCLHFVSNKFAFLFLIKFLSTSTQQQNVAVIVRRLKWHYGQINIIHLQSKIVCPFAHLRKAAKTLAWRKHSSWKFFFYFN